MKEAVDWIAQYRQFWEDKLESLGSYLGDFEPRSDFQDLDDPEQEISEGRKP